MTVDAVTGGSIQALCDARQLGMIARASPCAVQYNALLTQDELALMVQPGARRRIATSRRSASVAVTRGGAARQRHLASSTSGGGAVHMDAPRRLTAAASQAAISFCTAGIVAARSRRRARISIGT